MTVLSVVKDRTECRIEWCRRERVKDALYCGEHLDAFWRLDRTVTDTRPAWVRRMSQNAKDFTGSVA